MGTKNVSVLAMIKEPSVFELLRFECPSSVCFRMLVFDCQCLWPGHCLWFSSFLALHYENISIQIY